MEWTTPSAVLDPLQTHTTEVNWRVHVLASPDRRWRGRILQLGPQGCVLGRAPAGAHDAQIDDALLSRSHLELRPGPRADLLDVRDLGSRNGTFRCAQRVSTATVGHDTVLRLGSTVALVEADLGSARVYDHPTQEVPGRSRAARCIREALDHAAPGDAPVLIQGPTGSGKEYAVQELYRRSGRRGPIVYVSAPALAENAFETEFLGQHSADPSQGVQDLLPAAAGGLLVLDEIAELRPTHQARLLRLLDSGNQRAAGSAAELPPHTRFVATTNADLEDRIQEGRFRRDLLARLRTYVVTLPPLRARRADLLDWADVLVPLQHPQLTNWSMALAPDALEALLLHDWPENLRELRVVLQGLKTQLQAAPLPLRALPPQLRDGKSWQRPGGASPALTPEADVLRRLLARHYGNVATLARHFGRDRRQIYRWLDQAGIGDEELATYRRGE